VNPQRGFKTKLYKNGYRINNCFYLFFEMPTPLTLFQYLIYAIYTMLKLNCYVTDGGKNNIQDTYESSNDELKAEFESIVSRLLKCQRQEWTRPDAAKLNKAGKSGFRDYFEIRFFANKKQQRPIGYFGPGDNEFTILIWATEKGNQLKPATWREKADHAREVISAGNKRNVKEFEFEE
jgi:hypothetical protein